MTGRAGTAVRLLLAKDLRILRRSPLLVGLLVGYPVLIAVLIGLALSKGPDKPRVAVFNQLERGAEVSVGGSRVDPAQYAGRLLEVIEPVEVRSRAQAERMVRDGEALAAIIVPADLLERLQAAVGLTGGTRRPTVEVLYNAQDPVKQQFVESTITAQVAALNRALSDRLTEVAAGYLDILLKGGDFQLLGSRLDVLGLKRAKERIDAVVARTPPGSPDRTELQRVSRFAQLAIENLDLSGSVLRTVGSPVDVRKRVLEGRRTPLDAYALAIAVTLSLFLIAVLLASGMLALEREDHAFGRLVRGLMSRTAVVVEKTVLAGLCGLAATLIMVAGVSIFVPLAWDRFGHWVLALGAGGAAFGALGVAIGALARDVRVASLLAILLALPIAFVALVPDGSVSGPVQQAIDVVSSLFPFRPALDAVNAALNGIGGLGRPLVHLTALLVGWSVVARVGLRRFA